jgi:hypothetical protein
MGFFRTVAAAVGLSALLWGSFAYAQCTKDTECKGDRICRSGACEDPVPAAPAYPPAVGQPVAPAITPSAAYAPNAVGASAPVPEPVSNGVQEPQEPRGLRSLSAYASVASLVSLLGWGDGDREDHVGFGGHAAGYWALNPLLHFGGFFRGSYLRGSGPDGHAVGYGHYGVGVSMKVGGGPSDLVWIGTAVDFGVHFTSKSKGVEAFPRLETDIQVGQSGRLKTGLFASFGAMVASGAGGDYFVALQGLVGLMVGG